MNVAFHYHEAPAVKPVIFETIFAEKNGGGTLVNSDVDLPAGIAVGLNAEGKFAPIKGIIVSVKAEAEATTLTVAKGSGVKANEFYAFGKKAVQVTAVDDSNKDFDVISVAFGVAVPAGSVLYQAQGASASAAKPMFEPKYILGTYVPANNGDTLVKLVNGANIRKETAPVADELVATMKGITKI